MLQQERVKLLFGPYCVPKYTVGGSLVCRMRGKVIVTGVTDAPTPWPYTQHHGKGPKPSVIVCGDLVRALRRESAIAIAYWWGVSVVTVWRWRTEVGVKPYTDGTRDLLRRWLPENVGDEGLRKLNSPECTAKRAATRRGRPMHPKVKLALHKANKGRKVSIETRRRMSEAQKGRTWEPHGRKWMPAEEALLGTMSDSEVAKQIDRTFGSVRSRRHALGIASFFKQKPPSQAPKWTPNKDKLLGTMPDVELAKKLQCTPNSIRNRRRKLKVPGARRGG